MNKDKLKTIIIPVKQEALISLSDASQRLGLQNKQAVLYLINKRKLTKGVYRLSSRNIKINLNEFLENFKQEGTR